MVSRSRSCPKCNSIVIAQARFCPKCGNRLSQKSPTSKPLKCPNCGGTLKTNSLNCIWCGNKLSTERDKQPKKKIPKPYSETKSTSMIEPTIHKEVPIKEYKVSKEFILEKHDEPSLDLPPVDTMRESAKTEALTPIVSGNLESFKEVVSETPSEEHVSQEIRSLFSSIQYQVQDLIFEQGDIGPKVRIIPYSGSIEQILAEFDEHQVTMSGCLKRMNLPKVNLELKTDGEPRQPSWDDPWEEITLIGEEKIINKIKSRREIANRLASIGTAHIKVGSPTKGEICIRLTSNETPEVVKDAYLLIKDMQSFFELSYY